MPSAGPRSALLPILRIGACTAKNPGCCRCPVRANRLSPGDVFTGRLAAHLHLRREGLKSLPVMRGQWPNRPVSSHARSALHCAGRVPSELMVARILAVRASVVSGRSSLCWISPRALELGDVFLVVLPPGAAFDDVFVPAAAGRNLGLQFFFSVAVGKKIRLQPS